MRKLLAALVAIVVFFLTVKTSFADYGQYGETPSYGIIIDKMVGKPDTSQTDYNNVQYVDNLSPSDPRFKPVQYIYFKIKVKNTSSDKITNVTVKDYVPAYLSPVEGPGSWDSTNRIVSWNAGDFNVDEEKIYYLKMQIYSQKDLPSDKSLICLINKARAENEKTADEDTAQYCLEKQVLGVSTVPSAGPELGIILFGGELIALGTGLFLKKKNLYFEKKG